MKLFYGVLFAFLIMISCENKESQQVNYLISDSLLRDRLEIYANHRPLEYSDQERILKAIIDNDVWNQ